MVVNDSPVNMLPWHLLAGSVFLAEYQTVHDFREVGRYLIIPFSAAVHSSTIVRMCMSETSRRRVVSICVRGFSAQQRRVYLQSILFTVCRDSSPR